MLNTTVYVYIFDKNKAFWIKGMFTLSVLLYAVIKFSFLPILFQDLEAYAVCYSGFAKINRLLFIAAHCPALRVEALRMALNYTQTTYNTQAYQHIHSKLAEAVWVHSSVK